MSFEESSQLKRWMFTVEDLQAARHKARERSIAAITVAASGGALTAVSVSLAEEALLLKFYEAKVQAVCRELRFPRKVLGTAVAYLKRFFVARSALEQDPQAIALACLYLACKTEDSYLSAAELSRLTGTPSEVLLRSELPVLEGLNYDLVVHSPHRAVQGCFAELDTYRDAEGAASADRDTLAALSTEQLQQAKTAALAAADALLLTDAPLLYSPAQMGLAATRSGLNKIGVKLQHFVKHAAARALPPAAVPAELAGAERRLLDLLGEIDAMGGAGSAPVDQDQVAAIDRKLKACRSPLLDANSEAAVAARAQAKAAKAARKAAMRAEARAREEASVGVGGSAGREERMEEQEGGEQRKRARGEDGSG